MRARTAHSVLRNASRPLVAVLVALGAAQPAVAALTLQITTDNERVMKGAITGNETGTVYTPVVNNVPYSGGGYRNVESFAFASQGTNWHVWGDLTRDVYYTAANVFRTVSYELTLFGQHMVAPDPDEIAPNGLTLLVYADNLGGATDVGSRFPATQLSDQVPHLVTEHPDTMKLKLVDLNGAAAGVMGVTGQLAASFELKHVSAVPEPSAAWLLLAGVGALGSLARRRS